MSIEQDAASDGKKTLALAAVAVLIVAGAGYVGWGWMHQSAVPDSQYNLNRVANNATVSSQESRQYRELLKLANQQGAQAAESEGNSFVASLSESSQPDDVPVVPRVQATPVALDTRNGTSPPDTGQQGGLNDEQKQQITNLLTQLNTRWQTSDMQLASAFGSEGQDGASPFSQWAQSVPGLASPAQQTGAQATAGGAPAAATPRINIPGLTRYPGTIDTAIDSDNPESKVLAIIPAGKLAGATLAAPGVQLAGDGVIVNFKTLAFNGMTCTIDAYAQDDETQRSSIRAESLPAQQSDVPVTEDIPPAAAPHSETDSLAGEVSRALNSQQVYSEKTREGLAALARRVGNLEQQITELKKQRQETPVAVRQPTVATTASPAPKSSRASSSRAWSGNGAKVNSLYPGLTPIAAGRK